MRNMFLILFFCASLYAEKINVFVASSASKAFLQIKDEFLKQNKNDDIELTFGASGKHYHLLKKGREFDMFFSADTKYAKQIYNDNLALTKPKVYALGILALYSLNEDYVKNGLKYLSNENIKHISIANPKLAPYGAISVEILKNANLYDKVEDKLVIGDNISAPVTYVDTKASEVGMVAYSLVSPINNPKGKAVLIDKSLYTPLKQSFVITKYAKDKNLTNKFADFVLSSKGKEILKKYGFGVE